MHRGCRVPNARVTLLAQSGGEESGGEQRGRLSVETTDATAFLAFRLGHGKQPGRF
jgi:hypothetical protein